MCAALTAHGFPAGQLVVLGPTSPDPVPSVLVVETAAVRALFGSGLAAAWAPAILASFGSGPGAITVRVVAPHGAAAYQTSLNADLADRKKSGAALLNDSPITVSATARSRCSPARWTRGCCWRSRRWPGTSRSTSCDSGTSARAPVPASRSLRRPSPERPGCPHGSSRLRARRLGRPKRAQCPGPPGQGDLRDGSGPSPPPGRVQRAEPARKPGPGSS